jgi:hypothetical protein
MKLSSDEAEKTARVIEELFADLEDLRALAQGHGAHDAETVGQRTDVTVARVALLNVLHGATEGNLVDMTDEDARTLYLSMHENEATGYERGDCHCDHCDNALGELVLYLGVNKPGVGVYSPANLVRQEAVKRGWETAERGVDAAVS